MEVKCYFRQVSFFYTLLEAQVGYVKQSYLFDQRRSVKVRK